MSALTFPMLENGEWVTKSINLRHLLDHQKGSQSSTSNATDPLPSTPNLGLLSKTANRSPVINNILPARLRHKDLNDVVFVGEDFIHVKEIRSGASIEHIASKADFGARILASRVLGEVIAPLDSLDKNWGNHWVSEEDRAPEYGDHYDPMEVDTTQPELPPQLLVLTLENQQIVFVHLCQKSDGSHQFRQVAVPLPTSLDYLDALGRHLAVDPRSRAIAVGALEGSFAIYQTKEVDQLRGDFRKDVLDWCPVQAQQILKVNGVILKMEFLHPGSVDGNDIVLVLIVAWKGRTQIHSYAWDFSDGLEPHPVDFRIERIDEGEWQTWETYIYPLNLICFFKGEYQSPLLLIPRRNRRDFLLVCEHGNFIYKNVLARNSMMDSFQIFQPAPNYPGFSRRLPLWTSWVRPLRRYHNIPAEEAAGTYESEDLDFLYLLREDGAIVYLALSGVDRHDFTIDNATNIEGHFNEAFAVLPLKYSDPDVLILAGSASNGCLIKV